MITRINILTAFILFILISCELPERNASNANTINDLVEDNADYSQVDPNEEYVMVTTAINLPLYVRHDQAAFKAWGKKMGVKTTILGPAEWDVPAQIATIEQVIPTKPAGLLINGTDPGIAQAINKAVEAGIPTVVYDSEIPGSKRHCFIGSDWYQMGLAQGRRMAKLINGKGKVAVMGILGLTNMEAGFQGFQDGIKEFPDIIFLGKYDDKANVEEAARLAADLITANPDLAGIGGFDSNSGPGIALAVKEANKVGKIKITTVDAEPEHLQLVREGVIDLLVGQKRELFTWYGAQFLFDMKHHTNRFSINDLQTGIAPIPYTINTGLMEIDKNNIQNFK